MKYSKVKGCGLWNNYKETDTQSLRLIHPDRENIHTDRDTNKDAGTETAQTKRQTNYVRTVSET